MEESCTEASWKVGVTVASKLEGKEKWHKAGVCYEMQSLVGTEERGAPLPGSRTASSGGISALPGQPEFPLSQGTI